MSFYWSRVNYAEWATRGTFFVCTALHGLHRTREQLSSDVREMKTVNYHFKNVHNGILKTKKGEKKTCAII